MERKLNFLFWGLLPLFFLIFGFTAFAIHNKDLCEKRYDGPYGGLVLIFTVPCIIANQFPPAPPTNLGGEMHPAAVYEDGVERLARSCVGGYVGVIQTNDNLVCQSNGCDDSVRARWGGSKSSFLEDALDIHINIITLGLFGGKKHLSIETKNFKPVTITHCPPLQGATKLRLNGQEISELKIPALGGYELSWESPAAEACSVSGGPGDFFQQSMAPPNRGSQRFSSVSKGIYTHSLTCQGVLDGSTAVTKGSVVKTARVYVGDIPSPPRIIEFKTEPREIKKGGGATLSWRVENATVVSINQGVGVIQSTGNTKVFPDFTTRYTISATNGEFPELGSARRSVTVRVTSLGIIPEPKISEMPIEIPSDEPPELPPTKLESPKIDLKLNGQDSDLTMQAPASFTLSWNLSQYCIAHGSWFGVKTKAGEERQTERKPGNYTYNLYCLGSGSDSVNVKVITAPTAADKVSSVLVPFPVAEASASLDGINFSRSIRVVRGEKVKLWLSAAQDVDGDKKVSRDDVGKWTSALSLGGRCEWNADLNQGEPTFEAITVDPQNPKECTVPLGELTFYDQPGSYRYGALRLVQNDGKVSNVGYINVAVQEPPPPDSPPVINLRINNMEGKQITLGAPATYTLSWLVRNADSCQASEAWSGEKFLSGSQKFVASSKKELSYSLTCFGKLGTTTERVMLKVAELPICEFSALPTTLDKRSVLINQSALSWNCKFANSCGISPEVDEEIGTFGSVRVAPKSTTKYILTCENLEGKASFEQTVEVH